jgi:hypothetical protein
MFSAGSDLISLQRVKPEPSGSIRSKIITSILFEARAFSPSSMDSGLRQLQMIPWKDCNQWFCEYQFVFNN